MFQKATAAVVFAFAVLFAATALQAQSVPQRVNVPFKFNLMDKSYEPAMYYFRYENSSNRLELLDRNRALLTQVNVITRLAPAPGAIKGSHVRLVFDQVGQDRFLSEVWMPGIDGLLVRATSEQHQHQAVEGLMK